MRTSTQLCAPHPRHFIRQHPPRMEPDKNSSPLPDPALDGVDWHSRIQKPAPWTEGNIRMPEEPGNNSEVGGTVSARPVSPAHGSGCLTPSSNLQHFRPAAGPSHSEEFSGVTSIRTSIYQRGHCCHRADHPSWRRRQQQEPHRRDQNVPKGVPE